MATYEVGQTIAWGLKTYTAAGVLADLSGGNPTATVTLPDGTTASATVGKSATGTYYATYASTQAGRHRVLWAGSGDNSGGLPYTDVADVWPADPRLIISLADARAALNVADTWVVDDDELRGYLAAATIVVENIVGPVLPGSVVETHDGNGSTLLRLYKQPKAITSVVEDGVTLAATAYAIGAAGHLWRLNGAWSTTAPSNVVVTFTVGSSTIPQNVREAAAHLVRHWWQQGQQALYSVGGTPGEASTIYVAGYAVPNMVTDLLMPSKAGLTMVGFA